MVCDKGGGRRGNDPGYRIKNKNPTQRCGEKELLACGSAVYFWIFSEAVFSQF